MLQYEYSLHIVTSPQPAYALLIGSNQFRTTRHVVFQARRGDSLTAATAVGGAYPHVRVATRIQITVQNAADTVVMPKRYVCSMK